MINALGALAVPGAVVGNHWVSGYFLEDVIIFDNFGMLNSQLYDTVKKARVFISSKFLLEIMHGRQLNKFVPSIQFDFSNNIPTTS